MPEVGIVHHPFKIMPCRLVWLLSLENQVLVTSAIATDIGASSAEQFLQMVQINRPQGRFPFELNDNPFADVLFQHTPFYNLTPSELVNKSGGKHIAPILIDFGIYSISFIPLYQDEQALGVLVLGLSDITYARSVEGKQLIEMVAYQAQLELANRQTAKLHDQLKEEKAFRQLILETVGDGMVAVNANAEIVRVSRHLLQFTGYYQEDLLGRPITVMFSERSRISLMRSLAANRTATMSFSQELLSKGGEVIPVLMSRISTQSLRHLEETAIIVFSDLSALQQRQEALERQTQRLQALYRSAQAISSQMSLNEVIDIILSSASEVLQSVVASILLRDVDNPHEFIIVATIGPNAQQMNGRRIPEGLGIVGQVAASSRSRLIVDVNKDPDFLRGFDSDPDLDAKTLAAVPLIASDNVIGVLEVINKQRGGVFEGDDLTILENLAASAAIAIERASLFDQTHRRLLEMTTLLEASSAVTSTLELDKILELIARRLRDSLNVQHVVIATRENTIHSQLNIHAQVVNAQWERELDSCPRMVLKEAPFKLLSVAQRQVSQVSLRTPNLSPIEHRELELRGMGTVLNVPLRLKNRLVGLVCVYHEDPQFEFGSVYSTAIEDAILQWEAEARMPSEELGELATRILHVTRMTWCAIYLLDQPKENLFLLREVGTGLWKYNTGVVWELNDYPTMRQVMEQNVAMLVWTESLDEDEYEKSYLQQIGVGSCLMAPLIIRGAARGIVKLMTTDRRIFDEGELSLCQGIANVVGNAIENASLFASLEQRAQALEHAYLELEEADRLKDDLLQNVSHELSTPLMHALGYLSLMRDEAFGDINTEQKETLDLINRKTQMVADLVKNMVAVHASRSQKLDLKPTKLEQVAALTVRSMTAKAAAMNITILPRITPNLPKVLIDRVRLGEVFEALLDNAIKFSPHGSKIEVGIEDKGGTMLQVYVKDQGIGIDPLEHEKIFRRFYQVDGSTTRRYGGVGLGLAIVQNVIKSHGGKIWVESEIGRGATFYFTVPKTLTSDLLSTDETNALLP